MPSIEGGGVEKNLFIVSNYLSKKFKSVYLITSSIKFKHKFNRKIKIICPNNLFWENFGRKSKYFICLFLLLIQFVKNKNFTVFAFQANIYCLILCKIFNVKIIIRSNSAPIGWSKNFFKNIIFKNILQLANKTMVNSIEFNKELKKRYNIKPITIYNPLNKKEIIAKSKKKIRESFFNNKNINLINVARFTDQKDHLTLLRGVNLVKDKINVKLIIVGKGVNYVKMKRYIEENNLKKIVKIIKFVNNPFPYIKKADVFILTSKFEGLPNVLLEALTLKKFVISSNCQTGPKEILINGKGGLLFKVGDHKDLSKKILYYKNNKFKCNKMLLKAIKKLDRFNEKENLNKYLNLANSL